ncbi:hypothetical protein GCM10011428_59110 [Streptomyces violaceus]
MNTAQERLPVPLQLGALVGLDGVLDGQRVQVEELGDARELLVGRLVQPEPDEALPALAHPLHDIHQIPARGVRTPSRYVTQFTTEEPSGERAG